MYKSMSLEEFERKVVELSLRSKTPGPVELSNLLCNLGFRHKERGQFEEAIKAYRKAIEITPNRAYVHNGLAMVFIMSGRNSEAAECYAASLKLSPTNSEVLQNLATIRYEENNFEEAERLCRKAIKTSTDGCVVAHTILANIAGGRGNVAATQHHFAETLRSGYWEGDRFVQGDPKAVSLHNDVCWAMRLIRDEMRNNPTSANVLVGKLNVLLKECCDWKDYDDQVKKLSVVIDDQLHKNLDPPVDSPEAIMFPFSLQQQLAIATNFSQWSIKFGANHKAAANRIASDGIQILVNLNDYFKSDVKIDSASVIFAHRPAPIQVVYRSTLGTTGTSYVDYFITDKVASPLEFASGYSEKLAYMPNGMFVQPELLQKPQENLKEKAKLRKRFDLPESAVVFGVNSPPSTIDPEIFECWCEILDRVPQSVLWFSIPYMDKTQSNLKKEAKYRKINPHRLIFIDGSKMNPFGATRTDYLVDVVLDTSMCNSLNQMENICRGIPTATLPRESFTSRLTASLLTSIGCEELIAKSQLWYIEMNVNLGNQPELRQEMKDRMWENLPDSNLFRIDQYFNDLQNLYEKMWKLKEMGKLPEHIV